jgi:hypothetical protein
MTPEWAWCLHCGRPLTSWYSRYRGFGLHCRYKISRPLEIWRVNLAETDKADLDLLNHPKRGLRCKLQCIAAMLRLDLMSTSARLARRRYG